jgi:hypothetical protein
LSRAENSPPLLGYPYACSRIRKDMMAAGRHTLPSRPVART